MTSLYWQYFFADYYRLLEIVVGVVSVVIFLSSVDDLFVDACYWGRELYRALTVKRKYKKLSAEQLRECREKPMAIMVPAWLEYDVIAPMLANMVSTLEYKNYTIFVGTYQNDARTIAEVERMRRRYRLLVRVEVPHNGPTCKADCLNWVVLALLNHEKQMTEPFAGVVLHDSEDVLHPLELKYYNYLLPRMDFIQLPVSSLERSWYEMIACTYMDEFAESHTKDLVVREALSKMVPSAGVGTCFSRKALQVLSEETNNQPFNTGSLTEDYDIGARLSRMGMKQIFGKFDVDYVTRRVSWFGLGKEKVGTIQMPLGIREFFPDTFRTAYRQKARWTLGICLQGWEQVGWQGSWATKYLLFRDRKGLVTSFVAILGYVLMFNFLLFFIADALGLWTVYYPSLFSPNGWFMTLLVLNSVALALRTLQRAYFVTRMYGWEHGLLSMPRMVIGNFINAMAAARAWRMYLVSKIFGTRLVWDKTMHDFPSSDQLVQKHQRIGELLLSWRAIEEPHLNEALQIQAATGRQLGSILIEHGWLSKDTLEEAIAFQRDEMSAEEPQSVETPATATAS